MKKTTRKAPRGAQGRSRAVSGNGAQQPSVDVDQVAGVHSFRDTIRNSVHPLVIDTPDGPLLTQEGELKLLSHLLNRYLQAEDAELARSFLDPANQPTNPPASDERDERVFIRPPAETRGLGKRAETEGTVMESIDRLRGVLDDIEAAATHLQGKLDIVLLPAQPSGLGGAGTNSSAVERVKPSIGHIIDSLRERALVSRAILQDTISRVHLS